MVIRFPRSSSKSCDCLFIKLLLCWYCFGLLWYLESLFLRAYRRCLSVSSKMDLVCLSTIRYFAFIDFVFLFIFWWRSWMVNLRYLADIGVKIVYSPIRIECPISFSPVDVSSFDDTLIFDTRSFNRGNCFRVSKLIQTCDVNFFRWQWSSFNNMANFFQRYFKFFDSFSSGFRQVKSFIERSNDAFCISIDKCLFYF